MTKKIAQYLLKIAGWRVVNPYPQFDKSIVCVVPHTSNWDFVIGKLALMSYGWESGFLMKSTWFFFPLGLLFKSMGGVPVPRKKGSELSTAIVEKFNQTKKLTLVITPEGTRSLNPNWRKGFLYIATEAKIPICLAYLDFAKKEVGIEEIFHPTGNVEEDLLQIKKFYKEKNHMGRFPEKFSTGL